MLTFIKDPEIVSTGIMVLRALLIAIPFAAFQMLLMNALQAMGQGLPSLIVSLSRQGLIYIPALFALNWLFGFSGLVYAIPLADFGTTMMALFFFLRIAGRFKQPVPAKVMNA
jgi:Na+-driven multidrug efflux pump